ncbi:hypothetical protein LTR37_007045 [Vermiconidia calcicola]|uniref:Uncharacterized protein n=1 Tax=Vermiconidia calcicola TaxID=1690605 RepID=A0ACC3NEJ6_9PEZI|nr:hypothetical protein LTR37_007045 [Vermiconidia calcicola]
MAPATASNTIPYALRFLLTNVEPLFALNGAILLLLNTEMYLSTMSRGAVTTADASTNFIYTELAGGWLYLAFTEAVVLRLVDHISVWRLLCLGILFSDAAYCHSCAEAVGGWATWIMVQDWTAADWVVTLTTWPFVFARLAIVLGIGFKGESGVKRD